MTFLGSPVEGLTFASARKHPQNLKMILLEYIGIYLVALCGSTQCTDPRLRTLCLNQSDDNQHLTPKKFFNFWVIFDKSLTLLGPPLEGLNFILTRKHHQKLKMTLIEYLWLYLAALCGCIHCNDPYIMCSVSESDRWSTKVDPKVELFFDFRVIHEKFVTFLGPPVESLHFTSAINTTKT